MDESYQEIFTRSYTDFLREQLQKGIIIKDYLTPVVEYPADSKLQSTLAVSGEVPKLEYGANDDFDNAVKIFEYLRNLDKTQASDKRLWIYLSHVTFRDYTMNRWQLDYSEQDSMKLDEKRKAINYIAEHWFVSGNDRSMRRHSIARLWWAAYLTSAPWKNKPDYFQSLEHKDQYVYTRVLLSSQDIYLQILERGLGRSDEILITVLEFLRRNPEFSESRDNVRSLIKELNLALSYRKLSLLSYSNLYEAVSSAANTIAATI